jgi:hypothetical protein
VKTSKNAPASALAFDLKALRKKTGAGNRHYVVCLAEAEEAIRQTEGWTMCRQPSLEELRAEFYPDAPPPPPDCEHDWCLLGTQPPDDPEYGVRQLGRFFLGLEPKDAASDLLYQCDRCLCFKVEPGTKGGRR